MNAIFMKDQVKKSNKKTNLPLTKEIIGHEHEATICY